MPIVDSCKIAASQRHTGAPPVAQESLQGAGFPAEAMAPIASSECAGTPSLRTRHLSGSVGYKKRTRRLDDSRPPERDYFAWIDST